MSPSSAPGGGPRVRRKSRFGCRNCKLRKLKCDESKPQCEKCISFEVVCNFTSHTVPDLQPVVAATDKPLVVAPRRVVLPPRVPVSNAVWTCDEHTHHQYQLNSRCYDLITRYLGRNVVVPDDPNMLQVNRNILKLAFSHPFLMHASLAGAFTYDRYVNSGSSRSRRSLEECRHWSQSTFLLSKRLQAPIEAKDTDAIWATASALAILSFSSLDACTPDESWPLKPSGHSDLDWLRMNEAKAYLWHIVNPLRPDSIFRVMAGTFARINAPLPEKGVEAIPRPLIAVCGLDDSSTIDNNPYFHAAYAVSQILKVPDSKVTTGFTQVFPRTIRGTFKELLQKRDPVALLLLYLWYQKAGSNLWWIELRARVECPSICSYLRLCHKDNHAVLAFLPGGELADRWN